MAFDPHQFRTLIERVLAAENLWSPAAVELLLGTAAVESGFGTYLRQLGGGPALGPFQIEPATFDWLQGRYSRRFPSLRGREASELEWDLRLGILIARIRYRVVPEPLPPPDAILAMARYWKDHYNTWAGAGQPGYFVSAYGRFVSR